MARSTPSYTPVRNYALGFFLSACLLFSDISYGTFAPLRGFVHASNLYAQMVASSMFENISNSLSSFQQKKINQIIDLQIHNILISAGIILQTEQSTKAVGLGLIILWLGVTFLIPIIYSQSKSNKGKDTFYAILLGLLLIQARTILRIEDEFGLTQYFLIALGLAASASFSRKQWLRLLQWMGATAIPILILLIA